MKNEEKSCQIQNSISLLSWRSEIVSYLKSEVKGDVFWEGYLKNFVFSKPIQHNVHLAIFIEPYLQFILEGKKTVESRFSSIRCAPYGKVCKGDIVVLKRSGGPIIGLCQVSLAWFYELDPDSWQKIRREFMRALCAEDPDFWKDRQGASFATLMQLRHVRSLNPLEIQKRDRRGWVVLQEALEIPFSQHGFEFS